MNPEREGQNTAEKLYDTENGVTTFTSDQSKWHLIDRELIEKANREAILSLTLTPREQQILDDDEFDW